MQVITALMEVLRESRSAVDGSRAQIAAAIGGDQSAVDRLERGKTIPRSRQLDDFVAAYSGVVGVSESELWLRAIERAADESGSLADAVDAAGSLVSRKRSTHSQSGEGRARPPRQRSQKPTSAN